MTAARTLPVAQPLRWPGPESRQAPRSSRSPAALPQHRTADGRCSTSGGSHVDATELREIVRARRRGSGPARVRVARRADRVDRDWCGRRGWEQRLDDLPDHRDSAPERRVVVVRSASPGADAKRVGPSFPEMRWTEWTGRVVLGRGTLMQSPVAVAVALKWITDAQLRREADGQDLLEYALLCALIALFALGAVSAVGQTIYTIFWQTIAQNF